MSVSHAAAEGGGFDFGPYHVLSRLASGGMADVWLVETSQLSEPSDASADKRAAGLPMRVVLKTMRPEMASSRELSAMFVEEALVASKLRHENVVRVLDVGSIEGRHYIAMEYVRGCTLRQIAQRYHEQHKRFDAWFLLRVLLGACAALEYVHGYVDEKGQPLALVHGDVSPENIMISFSGIVKLVDFGIARASKTSTPEQATADQGTFVVGKPWYMAPERVRSGMVDGRSDLYSLGVILYEYLTGYRPYSGASGAEVMSKVLEGRPARPEELAPGISKSLANTTLRAMAVAPGKRFASAPQLAMELGARLRELDPKAATSPLDGHMARMFGDRDPVPSSVRLAPGARRGADSDLPTVPSDPAVIAAALALLERPTPARPSVKPGPPEPRNRSGLMRAHRSPPPLPSARAEAPTKTHAVLPAVTPPPPPPTKPPAAATATTTTATTTTAAATTTPSTPPPLAIPVAASRPPIKVDIFARAPRLQAADVFRKSGSAPPPPAAKRVVADRDPLTEKARQAARLFDEGLAARSSGDLARARDAWRGAVELDPTQRRYEANLRRLEERLRESGEKG